MLNFEFRIKEEDKYWDEIQPKNPLHLEDEADASRFASRLSTLLGTEVRWNKVGSNQGHYIRSNHELNKD